MEKKEKKIKWYQIILAIIVSICIYFSMLLGVYSLLNIKKSNAYTNDVVTYANVTDLTNTTWVFNDNIYIGQMVSGWTYNINFISNEEEFEQIYLANWYEDINFGENYMGYFNYTTSNFKNVVTGNISSDISNNWLNIAYKTISITDGNDVTNVDLINWLYENATIQQQIEEIYSISYNLQNVIVIGEKPTQISNLEEIEIEIQNFNNYELPQNIMVENASYNWNYETGILTIYDATGNVNITIRAEYISGNYSFIELIDSVVLIPLNTFFNLFNFELFEVNIYALLTATLTLFVIIKILLKVFK